MREMSTLPILLVEDNPDDIDLTLHAFARANIANQVVVAHDGVEALDLLFAQDGRDPIVPAVVLLDLQLPRLDGHEVLRRLRADPRTKLLPVVILTSSAAERDRIQSYTTGANAYVQKPVDFGEFLEAASVLGLFWLSINQVPWS